MNEVSKFEKWKSENYNELLEQYKKGKNCGDSMRSTDDITFKDFCIGKWQNR